MRGLRAAAAIALALSTSGAASGPGAPEPRRQLRVCADPNNLPFSNARGEGFENALAELVADALGAELSYAFLPQRRGFVRNTLAAGACDVMMGVPTSFERVLVTAPYYRSTYVFVHRRDGGVAPRSLDDPVLRRARIGVQVVGDDQANTPPAHALGRRGLAANVVGYSVQGDYGQADPPLRILEAVVRREVDVAVVWGPPAGWFARHRAPELALEPVSPQIDLPFLPFVFDIGMGVRRDDAALRDELDAVIRARRREIDALLAEFGFPRVDAPARAHDARDASSERAGGS